MKQYTVTGMSCAACSARVEKAVNKVPGVTSCSVSLLTNSMGVEGTASASAIVSAVEEAGYERGCETFSPRLAERVKLGVQIAKEYEDDFDHILCYGVSFFKKRCCIKLKDAKV